MTTLGGDFSVVSLITLPMTIKPEQVTADVQATFPDFTVAARVTSSITPGAEPAKILGIDFEGPDQPGLVKNFSDILMRYNVGLKDVVTDTSTVPFLGYSVFGLKSIVTVPFKTDFTAFERDLQEFETKFGLTMAVSDPNEGQEEDAEAPEDAKHPNIRQAQIETPPRRK